MNKITAQVLYDEIREEDSRGGLYVWVDPDEASVLQIQKLMHNAPFKTRNTTEYHSTVLFHEGELPHGVKPPIDRRTTATITQLVLWDDEKGRKIVVAMLDSPDLQRLHAELLGENLHHSFDDYNAHISVGKDVQMNAETRVWLEGRNEYLRVAPMEIRFDPRIKASALK